MTTNSLTVNVKFKNKNRTPQEVSCCLVSSLYRNNDIEIELVDSQLFFEDIKHDIKNMINALTLAEYEYYGNNDITQKIEKILDNFISKEHFSKNIDVIIDDS